MLLQIHAHLDVPDMFSFIPVMLADLAVGAGGALRMVPASPWLGSEQEAQVHFLHKSKHILELAYVNNILYQFMYIHQHYTYKACSS